MFDVFAELFPEPTMDDFRRVRRPGLGGARRDYLDGWELYVNANEPQRRRLAGQLLLAIARSQPINGAITAGFLREALRRLYHSPDVPSSTRSRQSTPPLLTMLARAA